MVSMMFTLNLKWLIFIEKHLNFPTVRFWSRKFVRWKKALKQQDWLNGRAKLVSGL